MDMVFDQALIPEEFKIEFFTILPVIGKLQDYRNGVWFNGGQKQRRGL